MPVKNSKIFRSAAVYTAVAFFNKALPFLMLPIMTFYLSPSGLGKASLFLVVTTCLSMLVGMNAPVLVTKSFFFSDMKKFAGLVSSAVFVIFLLVILCFLLLFFLRFYCDEILSLPLESYYVMLLLSACIVIKNIYLAILRNEEKAYTYAFYELSCSVSVFSLTLLFLSVFEIGWMSQAWALFCSNGIICVVSVCALSVRKIFRLRADLKTTAEFIRFALPMVPYGLSGIVVNSSDRIFIERMVGIDQVGVYTLGASLGMVVAMLTDAFSKAWNPYFYKIMSGGRHIDKLKIVRFSCSYILALFASSFLFSILILELLPYFVSDSFLGASDYVLLVALAYAVQGVYRLFFPYFVMMDKSHVLSSMMFFAAFLNIVANFFLVGNFGAVGAAFSLILSWMFCSIFAVVVHGRFIDMPWSSLFGGRSL